jgi:hypothetical protein
MAFRLSFREAPHVVNSSWFRTASDALFLATREQADKEASPTAAIIDSQSVKGAEKGGADRPVGL